MSSAVSLRWGAWRPWLVLGRVSNLPTVWSNCLAAWMLGGGGAGHRLGVLMMGASAVYVAGMLLNDAFDVAHDREHRRERPIPSGQVRAGWVWAAGVLLLLGGGALLASLGGATLHLGFLLAVSVVIYNAVHKLVPFSTLLMALCRFLLFLVAGSATANGVTGEIVWSGLALGGYVVGLSTIARTEGKGGLERWWPLGGLLLPLALAALTNPPSVWGRAEVAAPVAIWAVWTARSLLLLRRPTPDGARGAVSGLLAGIVLVDMMAVLPGALPWGAVFLGLFGAALVLQRWAPAT
ncbi:MAG: UbiA family prenyltransferase [Verrucomicrobiae bacterium]|nr:UbiA family prenyltransferase [Verrucomicrobiae bacterium]